MLLLQNNRGAAGTSVVIRQRNAIDVSFMHIWVRSQYLGYFTRGHIFTLPSEGVAESVVEVPPAFSVPPHHIASAEVCITLSQHVTNNFAFGSLRVLKISLESLYGVSRIDGIQQLTRLAPWHFLTETRLRVPPGLLRFMINLNNSQAAS